VYPRWYPFEKITQSWAVTQFGLQAPDEVKKGVYANNVFINHTPEEIVLDFLNVIPPAGSVVSRVVLNPSHAKRLVRALQENLDKYEKTFGEVPFEIKPIHE